MNSKTNYHEKLRLLLSRLSSNTNVLIAVSIAESVLYVFENKYPNDMRLTKSIKATRDYLEENISLEELNKTRKDAYDANETAYSAASDAYYKVDHTAMYVAYNASMAAYTATSGAHNAAYKAAYYAANATVNKKEQEKKNYEIALIYLTELEKELYL